MESLVEGDSTKFLRKTQGLTQYSTEVFVSLAAGLGMVCVGLNLGWASPVMYELETSDNPPFVLTPYASSLLASAVYVGVLAGTLVTYFFSARWSRNKILRATSFPFLSAFAIFAFHQTLYGYCIARVLGGLASGITLSLAPMYVCEIASSEIRGALVYLIELASGAGLFCGFVLVPYTSLETYSLVCLTIAFCQMVISCTIPESPHLLISRNDYTGAKAVLKKLRKTDNVSKEYSELCSYLEKQDTAVGLRGIFNNEYYRKAVFLTCLTILLHQSTGALCIQAYSKEIFSSSVIPISTDAMGILYCATGFTVVILAGSIVDKAGRKTLLLISATGSILALTSLGLYFFLREQGYLDATTYPYIPITCMIGHMVAGSIGVGPLPYLIMNEIMPSSARPLGGCIMTVLGSIVTIFSTYFFKVLEGVYGKCAPLWMFATATFVFGVLWFTLMPETKGKSFQEIEMELKSNKQVEKFDACLTQC